MSNVTAAQILIGIRKKYPKLAVLREVTIPDPFELAIYHKWKSQTGSRYYLDWAKKNNIPLAESVPEGWNPVQAKLERRIDALIFTTKSRTAVEIKVTRADFKRDVFEKRRAWMHYTHKFVYATPKGLVTKEEIPEGCGWWEYDPNLAGPGYWESGIVVSKRAVSRVAEELPPALITSLMGRLSRYEYLSERSKGND